MNTIEPAQKNQEASIRNSEKQIGQLVKLISERTLGALPSNIEVNPREHINGISMIVEGEKSAKRKRDHSAEVKKKWVQQKIVPKYVRHLRDMMMMKDKLREASTHILGEECSTLLAKKSVFSFPCTIDRALADLGASINVISSTLCERLGLGTPRPMTMSINLADRSVNIRKDLVFPVNFIVLNMDEKVDSPLFWVPIFFILQEH
ncbi:hypothetical protein M9H77_34206 [Catharanthus roseus]|uniref:Uncharacterized protein n=1 Tax=Catharanthus roseus TaxID=4058 RepID=A0ACB9ZKF9_CATRO|nr:hypothetical protein M9H77_34206 [Catharanthus roseus]